MDSLLTCLDVDFPFSTAGFFSLLEGSSGTLSLSPKLPFGLLALRSRAGSGALSFCLTFAPVLTVPAASPVGDGYLLSVTLALALAFALPVLYGGAKLLFPLDHCVCVVPGRGG